MLNNIRMLLYALIDSLGTSFWNQKQQCCTFNICGTAYTEGSCIHFFLHSSVNKLNLYIIYVANSLCTAQEVMRECLHVW